MPSHVLILCHAIEIRQIVTKGDNQQSKLSISQKATKLKMRFSVLLSLVKCMQPEEAKWTKKIKKKFETSFIHGCIFESWKKAMLLSLVCKIDKKLVMKLTDWTICLFWVCGPNHTHLALCRRLFGGPIYLLGYTRSND